MTTQYSVRSVIAYIAYRQMIEVDALIKDGFDPVFYRFLYPDLEHLDDENLLAHYNEIGWREYRDPCAWFSTAFYLKRYQDVQGAGLNPFYHYLTHGRGEGRLPSNMRAKRPASSKRLQVSVIVPNFENASLLEQHINSIAVQEWSPVEIIILYDASSDGGHEVIERATKDLAIPVKLIVDDAPSGNIFHQWEKGATLASGDLLWFFGANVECDKKFLETLAPYFSDSSVMIAFGAFDQASSEGLFNSESDNYCGRAEHGLGKGPRIDAASAWFKGPFGMQNLIDSVGGCLIRKQTLEREVWADAQTYSVCGEWYLYMHFARGGRIAFDPRTVTHFHSQVDNSSRGETHSAVFFEEHFRIALELQRQFGLSQAAVFAFYRRVAGLFYAQFKKETERNFSKFFHLNTILKQRRERRHVLMIIIGFFTGGGEIFPINLANAFVERGYTVSVMTLTEAGENEEIRGRLDSRIPVFERKLIEDIGFDRFLESYQIDLVHTHYVSADVDFHRAIQKQQLPYVVTHHGSYEISDIDPETLKSIMNAVRHWVYISEKNLSTLDALGLDRALTTKLPNAVPVRVATFPYTRESLGIENDAFVFGVASRAIQSKGWNIAVEALEKVRAESDVPVYVVLCGEGPHYQHFYDAYHKRPGVIFLGYQREVMAFYDMCDCALLPTRFAGESYPLTIVEAIMKYKPVISTDIGELRLMVEANNITAGILVPNLEDDDTFVAKLAEAMRAMLDADNYVRFSRGAQEMSAKYDFAKLVRDYEATYRIAGLAAR
ncbi:glycosyltransferase [Methylocystis sp. WRRC1]|uniref:glycosyltransferase n=1 Tax=Methylocystis sp. WRRC1 TaxID=1732014 RepID=UPI001D144F3D|nr:glycosyltransferase [Methylocystis sp. WRRC1]MCC3246487.1 glycosyltransferase [Methylocystis sp. WRRC1]